MAITEDSERLHQVVSEFMERSIIATNFALDEVLPLTGLPVGDTIAAARSIAGTGEVIMSAMTISRLHELVELTDEQKQWFLLGSLVQAVASRRLE